MKYYSTTDCNVTATLEQAVIRGLAPDHGLFMPEQLPVLPSAFVRNMASMSLGEISYAVANYALQGDVEAEVLKRIVSDTFCYDMPLCHLADNRYVLELFHGPTLSFKDLGTRFLARLLQYYNSRHRRNINVVVATSGNSGGAIAHAFTDISDVNVYVLYPHHGLDEVQRAQFAAVDKPNITAIEVNGTLDDCRNIVDQTFRDPEVSSRMIVNSARTVNVARLLPQMFCYFYAAAQLMQREQDPSQAVIAVPCGNLGNLTAGLMAKRMGLPVKRFVAACGVNDTFARYLVTGDYSPRQRVESIAPAIALPDPSNFSRIKDLYPSHADLCLDVQPFTCADDAVVDWMRRAYHDDGYIVDPHTAIAYGAVCSQLRPGETGVALATAHPAKYRHTVDRVLNTHIAMPPQLSDALNAPQRIEHINSGYNSFKKFLLSRH